VCKPTDPENVFFREFSAAESVSGRAETGGLVQQVALLKQMRPQIKVLPSLGGATLSKWFSLASLTAESRATLIDSCVDLWINGDYSDEENGAGANFAGVFDGVDIDWEFPAYVDPETGEPQDRTGNGLSIDAGDAENYNLLAQEFRAAFDDPRAIETKIQQLVNELDLRGNPAHRRSGRGSHHPLPAARRLILGMGKARGGARRGC